MKKKILITGSTDGIGSLAARNLSAQGHEILLHGRNSEKLEQLASELSNTENPLKYFRADLSEPGQVRQMAKQIAAEIDELDVLINNAGVFLSRAELNKAGLDMRFAVNYFAPVLLTQELLPLLKKSPMPRLINLSSAAQSPVDLQVLRGNQRIGSQEAYAQSKLALTMWSTYLAEKLPWLTVIAVNPGSLLNTKMVQEAYGQHWSPATKGADILVELSTSGAYDSNSGAYFDNDKGRLGSAHGDAYDQAKIHSLIQETHAILETL